MEVPAQRVRHGLRFVEIVEAGEIAPTGIAAQLDESSPEHDPEQQPAKEPNGNLLRDYSRAAEKHREEACFEQNRFPSEAVECLPDIHERKVEEIDGQPNTDREPGVAGGDPGDDEAGKYDSYPSRNCKCQIAGRPEEQAWRLAKRHLFDKQRHGKQSPFPEQRFELIQGDNEGDQADEADAALE